MESVKIDGIEISIERKKIRNLYVKVNSYTGEAEATASFKMPMPEIENFLRSKINWIKKHKTAAETRPAIFKNNYVDGEKILFQGSKRVLRVFDYRAAPKVFLTYDGIDLYINLSSDKEKRRKALDNFYNAELAKIVPAFVSKWVAKLNIKISNSIFDKIQSKLFKRGGNIETSETLVSKEPKIFYKRMKSRWGVCNISENKITLNTELAKKTPRCAEYVVAHELLHLKERNHNKDFKDYMKKVFPDWKKLEEELKFL